MGCDIHGFIERRVNDEWVAIKKLRDRSRNYRRFNQLASVRGYFGEPKGLDPKGIPNDASKATLFWIDSWDGHSHSFLSFNEAFKIFKETSGDAENYCEYDFCGLETIEIEDINVDEIRLVFWFDS